MILVDCSDLNPRKLTGRVQVNALCRVRQESQLSNNIFVKHLLFLIWKIRDLIGFGHPLTVSARPNAQQLVCIVGKNWADMISSTGRGKTKRCCEQSVVEKKILHSKCMVPLMSPDSMMKRGTVHFDSSGQGDLAWFCSVGLWLGWLTHESFWRF